MIKTLAITMVVVPFFLGTPTSGATSSEGEGNQIQGAPISGSPGRGRRLFGEKNCSICHAILGKGGNIGLDLAMNSQQRSFNSLLSRFWDHSPELLKSMKKDPSQWTQFDSEDMRDLVCYIFYLNGYERLGDFLRGRKVFESKGCAECHLVGTIGAEDGIVLDKFAASGSALGFVTALWNRGSRMASHFRQSDMERPRFSGTDAADLHAFLRGSVRKIEANTDYMSPGKPSVGRQVFIDRGCATCHKVQGKGNPKKEGPDLRPKSLRLSVSEITGVLWNHGGLIWSSQADAEAEQVAKKVFTVDEMANLVAYLYSIAFFGEEGSAEIGRKLFRTRGCLSCHEDDDIEQIKDPIDVATKMWNHVHSKEGEDGEKQTWPRFTPEEAGHLARYLMSPKDEDK